MEMALSPHDSENDKTDAQDDEDENAVEMDEGMYTVMHGMTVLIGGWLRSIYPTSVAAYWQLGTNKL